VCACIRERKRERERESACGRESVCACVRVCVCEREYAYVCVCVCVHVCVCTSLSVFVCARQHAPWRSHRGILTYRIRVLFPRKNEYGSHSSLSICLHTTVVAICLSAHALLYNCTLPTSTCSSMTAAWRQLRPVLVVSMVN